MDLSKDGETVVVGCADGQVLVLRTDNWQPKIAKAPFYVSIDVHPSGEFLAAGRTDGKVDFLKFPDFEVISTIDVGDFDIRVKFDPTGQLMATDDGGHQQQRAIRVWDVSSRKIKRTLVEQKLFDVVSFTFSDDGQLLAVAGADPTNTGRRTLELWNTETGALVNSFSGHSNKTYGVAISLDNNSCGASASHQSAVTITLL